jgi:4-amino-4-deoxy-L-arabinose transferase-like glycosyltransferase
MPKKSAWKISLILIIALGLFWRLKWWPELLTFNYEQVRDALASQKIFFQKKLTLIGPTTEIEGVFAGPLYYYLIGAIYFLYGQGPDLVALFYILLNLTTIPIIFYIGKGLFNKSTGLIAALIFAVGFEVSSYSLWLSNPPLALPFVIAAFFLFYQAFSKNQRLLPFAAFLLGLAVQFELIISLSLMAVLALYFIYQKGELKVKTIIVSLTTFSIPLFYYPLFEIRHNFLMTKSLFKFLIRQETSYRSVFDYLSTYFYGLAREFTNLLFPIHGFLAGIFMFGLFYFLYGKIRKKGGSRSAWPFLLVWLLSTFPFFLTSAPIEHSEYAFLGVGAPIALLTAAFIDELSAKKKLAAFLIISTIFLGNFLGWHNNFPNPKKRMFDAYQGMILSQEKAAIDYTYQEAAGEKFFVETITVPLYISPLWDYLYSWYGLKNYGYLPSQDQKTELQFLIIEPGWDKTYQIFREKDRTKMDEKTETMESQEFGMILVEKRQSKTHP